MLRRIVIALTALVVTREADAQVSMPDTVCVGTSRTYAVRDSAVNSSYTWKVDGVVQASATHQLSVTWGAPGTYLLSVQAHGAGSCEGDVQTGRVVVKAPPVADAGPDAVLCFGASGTLSGSGGTRYHWSPGTYLSDSTSAHPGLHPPGAGNYTYVLEVSDGSGCTAGKKDTVVVTVRPQLTVSAGRDTAVLAGQPIPLHAVDGGNAGFTNWLWSPAFGLSDPSGRDPVATVTSDITYLLTARTAEGCTAQDGVSIKVFARADLLVPTAFTPNGDGKNDVFSVIPIGIREAKYFNVYTRWGELVFTTKDFSKGWDGLIAGHPQTTQTFVWIAAGIDFQGHLITRKGTVTLIK